MSTKKIYYNHDFFKQAVTGMFSYLNQLMKPYKNTLNNDVFYIGLANTGDEKFLMDMIEDKAVYSNVPIWTFHILGINPKNDDRTNPHENGVFIAETRNALGKKNIENFTAPLARRPVELGFSSQVKFSNIFEYFTFVEIYLMLSTYPHLYEFYHAGKRHIGMFSLPEIPDSDVNVTFGMEAEKRERKLELPIILNLQFPAYRIYGIPGTSNEGYNGDGEGGEGGGTDDTAAGPMLKIIHNIMPRHNENDKSEKLVITQVVTKPIEQYNPDEENTDEED
jgi:hypothetical protein